jgi:hypothetical protein
MKQQKSWFYEKCLGFLDQMKQKIMKRLQDPNQSNVDNLNNVRHVASRQSGKKEEISES